MDRVPAQIRAAITKGAIDSRRNTPVGIDVNKLGGWAIESFRVPGEPPLSSAYDLYESGKHFLGRVEPSPFDADQVFALDTFWMVQHCISWVLSVRTAYDVELNMSKKLKLSPVQCARIVKPDGSEVFDMASFTAEVGSFIDPRNFEATAKRLRPWEQVYGIFVRSVERDLEQVNAIDGFVIKQEIARRYTHRTTVFKIFELGYKRMNDSYVLMLVAPRVLTVLHGIYPAEFKAGDLWASLARVIEAIYQ